MIFVSQWHVERHCDIFVNPYAINGASIQQSLTSTFGDTNYVDEHHEALKPDFDRCPVERRCNDS
jgi:hypothetical protein